MKENNTEAVYCHVASPTGFLPKLNLGRATFQDQSEATGRLDRVNQEIGGNFT